MRISLFVTGLILFTTGVAFIYWQAALICLGLLLAFIAIRLPEHQVTPSVPTTKSVSKPDLNIN